MSISLLTSGEFRPNEFRCNGQTIEMTAAGEDFEIDRFQSVRRFIEIDSTNRWLREAVQQGTVGDADVVIADSQTAGRGRLDRQWVAPPLSGLLMSVLVRPSPVRLPMEKWPLVSFALALAVRDAVLELVGSAAGVTVGVKWPNDVVVNDPSSATGYRKLAGILVESVKGTLIAGVGVNVTRPADVATDLGVAAIPIWISELGESGDAVRLTESSKNEALTLELSAPEGDAATGSIRRAHDRDQCAEAVLRHFAGQLELLEEDRTTFLDQYREHCVTLNTTVTAEVGSEQLSGIAFAVADSGEIIIRTDAGDRQLSVSEVTHVRPVHHP
jgi:BirA family transcriptional regulator, biotin operon repressor / biotin---[acetyl-CoA-carboxylase] ligase